MSFASVKPFFVHLSPYIVSAAPWTAAGALFLSIIALFLFLALRRRLGRLALGRTGSIEESVNILSRDTKELQKFRAELEHYLKVAEARLRGSIRGVGVVRFNPFGGTGGGNQSFAVALLDEKHSGVVLSTLYARDRVGVYAKPVDAGASSFELTGEEREAIAKAKESMALGHNRIAETVTARPDK
jgi:Protein of unknown function (DUF4446)